MHLGPAPAEEQRVEISVGKPLILTCILDNSTNLGAHWANGTQSILSLEIANATKNRVTIGPKNELHFKSVRKYDNNTYTCWQGEYLKARYLLKFEEKQEEGESIWPYLGYLALTYVVDGIIFVVVYVYTARDKVTQVPN